MKKYNIKQLPIGEKIKIGEYNYILTDEPISPDGWYIDHEKYLLTDIPTALDLETGKWFNPYNPVEFCDNDQGLADYINRPGKQYTSKKVLFSDNPELLATGVKNIKQ